MNSTEMREWSWTDAWLPAALLGVAGVGWWWSVVSMTGDAMSMDTEPGMPMETAPMMSFAGFLIAWVAMMAAMMLPAVLPVVRAYARAATGSAAPAIVFVAGYLALWSATGIPAFWAWSHLNGPLAHGSPWVGRLAGAIALAAGIYQLTPLKAACLRHCYWPLSVSPPCGKYHDSPARALRAGGRYGVFCLGSCWMLFVVMIAFGTMQLAWMLALSVVIWLERVASFGDWLTRVTGAVLVILGVVLLAHPALVINLV
ncbi:hypothetical protein BST28_19530 [Mycolicibacter kumamotonensis]|uniref:DUF2182 domain-containing protein n=1 Tax=Mycolicibacter kumamotonensis TaxID=354243 RepID=A0A1X0DXD7_9MYCO|nr:DUF2182 domain-containing protein [Mycolicibacter kumamotonensis]ORA77007.1 hypothetical protein BST28_19530 [Mycolicibacter kumamotonensis]